jgi:hypothetical protein
MANANLRVRTLDTDKLPMQDQTRERWQELCRLAANEEDPINLAKLLAEMNLLLAKRLDYLAGRAAETEKIPRSAQI